MATIFQPLTLADLAIESFTNYFEEEFCSLVNKLITERNFSEISSRFVAKCAHLERFLEDSFLPPLFANELTKLLLIKIKAAFWEVEATRVSQYTYTEPMSKIVKAILQPTLTELKLGPRHLHNSENSFFDFIIPIVGQELSKLQRLRMLHLEVYNGGVRSSFCGAYPRTLERLTVLRVLTDNDVRFIAETLKSLTFLNVSHSKEVTDVSIEHILKIENLSGLYVANTGISNEGTTKLIQSLSEIGDDSQRKRKIDQFGFRSITQSHVELVVQHLPSITELFLVVQNESHLFPLTKLHSLQALCLDGLQDITLLCDEILPKLERLHTLDVQVFKYDDVDKIGAVCSKLKCLNLTAEELYEDSKNVEPPQTSQGTQLTRFLTIECLEIELEYDPHTTEYVLQQCLNVKRLNVALKISNLELRGLLERQSFIQLEELFWSPSLDIDEDTANDLINKSNNLRVVQGFTINKRSRFYRGVRFYK